MMQTVTFGKYLLPMSQIFLLREHAYATVNIKPFLPGHVLVCSRRPVAKLDSLTHEEVKSLFSIAQEISKKLSFINKCVYNFSIQNGKESGQTVPHVHIHVCPAFVEGSLKRVQGGANRSQQQMDKEAAVYRPYFLQKPPLE